MTKKCILLVLFIENGLTKAHLSAITAAKEASTLAGCSYDILAVGKKNDQLKDTLKNSGGNRLFYTFADSLNLFIPETVVPIVKNIASTDRYRLIISDSSVVSRDILAKSAAALDAGMATDVMKIEYQDNAYIYTRPMYAGNIAAHVKIETPLEIITVRSTEYEPFNYVESKSITEIIEMDAPEQSTLQVEFLEFQKSESSRPSLLEAETVVAGGRGVKSKEHFEQLIEGLADLLGGAAGASRSAVDAGFTDNDFQIGQTGKIVAPNLYIAAGISGALQHTAGIRSSKNIVAINKDPEAPVFKIADFKMVADLFEILPQLIKIITNK